MPGKSGAFPGGNGFRLDGETAILDKRRYLVEKRGLFNIGVRCAVAGCSIAAFFPRDASSGSARDATITQVVRDVTLHVPSGATEAALVNQAVSENASLRTGVDSRAEVTFARQTRARLGANTVFSFKHGSREMDLDEGVLLLCAPRRGGHVKVRASGISAAVADGTAVMEYHQASFKFLVLQGTCRLYRPAHLGDSVLVRAGQMVIGNPAAPLSDPVDFDVGRFVKTCRLITDFAPLGSEQLMAKASQVQQRAKSRHALFDTNLVIFGEGTVVSLVSPDPNTAPNEQEKQDSQNPNPSAISQTATMESPRVDDRATAITR